MHPSRKVAHWCLRQAFSNRSDGIVSDAFAATIQSIVLLDRCMAITAIDRFNPCQQKLCDTTFQSIVSMDCWTAICVGIIILF